MACQMLLQILRKINNIITKQCKHTMSTVQFRFYEELNDFLPLEKRKVCFSYHVLSKTAIKDVIESLGVPHTEIDLILVNGKSVDFSYQIQENDYISVYPVFESLNISPIICLRPEPLRKTQFILDAHLGKLAKYLRLLGFDVEYDNHFSDEIIATRSKNEKRIVLTRDIGLLKYKIITHGYWVRNTDPEEQVVEILKRFDLANQCHPFTRCIVCNGILEIVEKNQITEILPPLTQKYYQNFMRCNLCSKVYWEGVHYEKLKNWVNKIISRLT